VERATLPVSAGYQPGDSKFQRSPIGEQKYFQSRRQVAAGFGLVARSTRNLAKAVMATQFVETL
jgi:hypothetical protein